MTLSSNDIACIVIGLSLVLYIDIVGIVYLFNKKASAFTSNQVFYLKKWSYISFVLFLNAAGCALVYYTSNLQDILYIILVMKSKDIIMALMFPINMLIKACFSVKTPIVSLETPNTSSNRILAFVPTYKESKEQIRRTVNSLISQSNENVVLFVVSDGHDDNTFLFDDVKYTHNSSYVSWNGQDVDVAVSYGLYNGAKIVVLHKNKNMGKKDSIILCHEMFNMMNKEFVLSTEIKNSIKEHFDITQFDYIFGTDADTIVSDNTFSFLIESINSRNAIASCGILNPDKSHGSFAWNHLQNFQYMYGQYMRRTNEDVFSQVLCLPGCVSMFKVDECINNALRLYSETPDPKCLVTSCVQHVGTDRRLTSLLVSSNATNRIVLDTRVHAYTCVPDNISLFLKQRTRWCQNMYFNTLLNIVAPNVNLLLRFFNAIDFLRLTFVYFRFFNTTYFIFLLASNFTSKDILNLVPYIVILSYPVVVFLIYSLFNSHLRNQYVSIVLSLIVNKIFSFFSTITIFTLMLCNIGNNVW